MTTLDRKKPVLAGRKARALAALLDTPTVVAAARSCGVGERTLRRWLAEDTQFSAAFRAARRELVDQITARLAVAAGKALDVLVEVMEDAASPPAVRVASAGKVLDLSVRVSERASTGDGPEMAPLITVRLSQGMVPPSEEDEACVGPKP